MPRGFLHIDGKFVAAHREEIVSALRTETDGSTIPAGMLDCRDESTGGLLVTTTTDQLAIRLGHALERVFNGRLLFGISSETSLAHVWWQR